MKPQKKYVLMTAAGWVTLIAVIGCSTETPVKTEPPSSQAPNPQPIVANGQMLPVYFEANQSTLSDDAKETLRKNAEWLKDNLPVIIEVRGSSDSRGTPEQALAIGQRRAAAIREYYAMLGVPKSRIATVSLGQTSPVCVQEMEDCWKQNRRGDTHIENKTQAS